MTGALAVVIAIAAVLAGKYAEVSLVVDDVGGMVAKRIQVTDALATGMIAQDVVKEWQGAGKRLNWPEGMDPDTAKEASEEAEFPKDVWVEARKRWTSASEEWRRDFKARKEAELKAEFATIVSNAKGEGFFANFRLFDVLWFFLAIASAYGVGSGTGTGGDD